MHLARDHGPSASVGELAQPPPQQILDPGDNEIGSWRASENLPEATGSHQQAREVPSGHIQEASWGAVQTHRPAFAETAQRPA